MLHSPNQGMWRIPNLRIDTQGRSCIIVAVTLVVLRETLHVLQMERCAVTVETKDILVGLAEMLQNRLTTKWPLVCDNQA